MAEGLRRGRSDPLAVKFGRVMSDPAMRERCLALKFGESTTAYIAAGFVLFALTFVVNAAARAVAGGRVNI